MFSYKIWWDTKDPLEQENWYKKNEPLALKLQKYKQ